MCVLTNIKLLIIRIIIITIIIDMLIHLLKALNNTNYDKELGKLISYFIK